MTPDQVRLVRATWQQVVPIADTAARLFYERLFVLEPEIRPLFAHTDLRQQREQLLHVLSGVVATADRLHVLGPALKELGRRHAAYGIQDRYYDLGAVALLATLEEGLGAAFTDEVRKAWTAAYTGVVSLMLAGAREGYQAA